MELLNFLLQHGYLDLCESGGRHLKFLVQSSYSKREMIN